ncbi:MAG: MlaC/ttg2D family ABC transporter substrate-binding protein [Roseicyclus sp.]
MTTSRTSSLSRRDLVALALGGAAALGLSAREAPAQSPDAAAALVDAIMSDVMRVINSGSGEAAMIRDFERIFRDYADVPIIAQSVVGPPWRSASAADRRAFIQSFQGYMARRYGRQFRDFIGGEVVVTGARQVRSFIEVVSTARVPGSAPYEVRWLVSDGSGRTRFFNIIIEGVNLMVTERSAIGAMLDARGGDLGRLAADMRSLG